MRTGSLNSSYSKRDVSFIMEELEAAEINAEIRDFYYYADHYVAGVRRDETSVA